jgi:hypothetical protein
VRPSVSLQDIYDSLAVKHGPTWGYLQLTRQISFALNDSSEMRRWRKELEAIAERRISPSAMRHKSSGYKGRNREGQGLT